MAQSEERSKKIVAQIDINIVPNDVPTYREQFLDDYQNCPLCGEELLFTHVTHFVDSNVAEEAHCQSCQIRVKNDQHQLH